MIVVLVVVPSLFLDPIDPAETDVFDLRGLWLCAGLLTAEGARLRMRLRGRVVGGSEVGRVGGAGKNGVSGGCLSVCGWGWDVVCLRGGRVRVEGGSAGRGFGFGVAAGMGAEEFRGAEG